MPIHPRRLPSPTRRGLIAPIRAAPQRLPSCPRPASAAAPASTSVSSAPMAIEPLLSGPPLARTPGPAEGIGERAAARVALAADPRTVVRSVAARPGPRGPAAARALVRAVVVRVADVVRVG